jgi:hypothetical protein
MHQCFGRLSAVPVVLQLLQLHHVDPSAEQALSIDRQPCGNREGKAVGR